MPRLRRLRQWVSASPCYCWRHSSIFNLEMWFFISACLSLAWSLSYALFPHVSLMIMARLIRDCSRRIDTLEHHPGDCCHGYSTRVVNDFRGAPFYCCSLDL
ncbi:hypothetical protein F5X97DRAFT_315680, partial [Nemania serpens]